MTSTWWSDERVLDQFRDWLSRTGDDIESLNGHDIEDSSPKVLAEENDGLAIGVEISSEPVPEVGLRSLLEAFTALRHELKLQTKSARGLEDTVQLAVRSLDGAIGQFQSIRSQEQDAVDLAAKPLVESLMTSHEALLRGLRAFETMHRQMTQTVSQRLRESLDEQFRKLPWWRRMLTQGWHEHVCDAGERAITQASDENFARLLEGLGLILARLERALGEHQIRRIECQGRRVDPAQMSVVELVDSDAPPETVVAELRPGYTWHGHVLRFAEVRAVRNPETIDR